MLSKDDERTQQPQGSPGYDPGFRRATPGDRYRKTRQRRSQNRRKTMKLWTIVSIVVVALGLAAGLFEGIRRISAPDQPAPTKPKQMQTTWLLVGTSESDPEGKAHWLAVLSWDDKAKRGVYVYVPRTIYAEIPGHGLETIDRSLSLGDEPLLLSATSNLLGIGFDRYLRMSDQSIRALFDKIGGIDLTLGQRLTVENQGRVETLFAEGEQHMDGKRVAEYLNFVDPAGDEISRSVRHSEIWSKLFDLFREKKGGLGKFMSGSIDLFKTDAPPPDLERFFEAFSRAERTAVLFETLPVKPTGVGGGSQLYAIDREKADEMVQNYLPGSRPEGSGRSGRRIEILNGNGTPGIGQEVSAELVPKGFRVILNQNAKHFDYPVTQIVVYSDSKEALATGREIAGILGVGELIVSRQKQSIVDVTIVVGKDYLTKKG